MTFTTEDALRIAKKSGFLVSNERWIHGGNLIEQLTRALNLAAAEVLHHMSAVRWTHSEMKGLSEEYRAAAKGE